MKKVTALFLTLTLLTGITITSSGNILPPPLVN